MVPKKLSISCALAHVLISPCVNPKRLPDGQFLLEKLLSSLLRPNVVLETLDKTSITQVVLVLRMLLYMAIKNPRSKLGPPAMLKAVSNLDSAEAKLLVDIVTKDAGPFLDQLDTLFDGPGLVCGSKLHNMLIETHSAQQGNPLYDKCVEFCNLASDTDTLVSPSVVACFRKKVRHALEVVNLKRPRPTDANFAQATSKSFDTTKTNRSPTSQPTTPQLSTMSNLCADKTNTKTPTAKPRPLKSHAVKANSADTKLKTKQLNKGLVQSTKSETKSDTTSEAKKTKKKPDQVHETNLVGNKSETNKPDTKPAPKKLKNKPEQIHGTKVDTKLETKTLADTEVETKKLKRKLGQTQETKSKNTKLGTKKTTNPECDKSKPALKKRKLVKQAPTHLKRPKVEACQTLERTAIKATEAEADMPPSLGAPTKTRNIVKKKRGLLAKQKDVCRDFEYDTTSKKLKLSKKPKNLLDKPCPTTSSTTNSTTSSTSSTEIVKKVGCYYPDPPEGGWYGVVSNAAVIFTFTHLPLLVERSNKRENKRKKGDKPVQVVLRVVQHKDSVSLVLVQNLGDCLAHVDLGMADFSGLLGVALAVDRQALRNIPILTCAEGLCMSFDPATMLLTCSVNSSSRATLFESKVDYLKFQVPTYPPASVVCCFQVPSKSLAMLFGKSARHASATFRLRVTRDIKRKRLFVELCMARKTNESAKIFLGADQDEQLQDEQLQDDQKDGTKQNDDQVGQPPRVNLVTNHLKMPYARDVSHVLATRASTGVSLARKYSESAPDLVVLFDGVFTTAIANILVNSRAYTSVIFEPYTEQRLSIIIASNDTMLCVLHARADLPSSSSSSSSSSNSSSSNDSSGTLPTCSSSSAPNSLTLDGNTL